MTTQLKPATSGSYTTITKKSGLPMAVDKTSTNMPAASRPDLQHQAQLAVNTWLFGAQLLGAGATGNGGAGVGSFMLYAQKLAAASGVILKEI
jgi:hypothetical protein